MHAELAARRIPFDGGRQAVVEVHVAVALSGQGWVDVVPVLAGRDGDLWLDSGFSSSLVDDCEGCDLERAAAADLKDPPERLAIDGDLGYVLAGELLDRHELAVLSC